MSKFNTKKIVEKVENRAGGQAYKQSDEMAFVSLLLTSFVKDQFYRKANESLSDMKGYIKKIKDKEFLAKSAIFARDEFGMRSITHALAGELASEISGKEWSKNFYSKVVSRVDDMSEILSYYLQNKTDIKSPKFPNSLKKGFAKAFDKFDAYQLGKYRSENKDVKLVDIVNLVHPTPTKKNGEALSQLINGDLKSTGTWESMLTSAGQKANDEEELKDLKADAWDELLSTRRIGYFGLLRNLRNIITQSPKSVTKACEMLVDENLIAKSKVLPFRFSKAYDEISKLDSNKEVRDVLKAINEALNISVMNVPKLDGETLVVIDVSGSMSGTPSEIASLFGAMLIKANECDVMTFATNAQYINYDPSDTVISLRNKFRFSGGGTNVKSVFEKANKSYDNIILLSDFQSWIGYTTPTKEYNAYKKKYNVNPHVFSWDLAGMSTLQFPENQIYCLAGFSDKVFDVMKFLKTDKKALLNRINSIQI
jgi:hypothetical protein